MGMCSNFGPAERWRPEALALGAGCRPTHAGEHSCNPLLVAVSYLACCDIERAVRHFRDGGALKSRDESRNRLFPCIGLEAGVLLRLDMLAFERGVGPPFPACPE